MRSRAARRTAPALAALALAVPAPAWAGSGETAAQSGYEFTLRAGAVENFVHLFREMAQGIGFSRVTLTRDAGARSGETEAVGAGAWSLLEDEPCLLGCDPPCTAPMIGNPTMARSSFPRSCADQRAGLFLAGSTPPAGAVADGPASGDGAGRALGVSTFPGVRVGAAGSEVSATVSPQGVYVGVARSYVQHLVTAAGEVDSISSLMRVTAKPDGSLPRVTYAFTIVGASAQGSHTGLDEENFTLFGREVPLSEVVAHFNDEVSNVAGLLGVLGQLGVRLLEPHVGLSDDGSRYRIAAPVLVVAAEQGLATQGLSLRNGGVRIAGGVFEGSYDEPEPAPR